MAFEGLTEKLSNAFKKLRGKGRLSEADVKESMREIRLALLEADVNYKVVKDFIKKTTERCVGTDVLESLTPAQMIVKIVNEELTALMGSENQKIKIASQPPTVVMLVGLQGAGKTTNGAKLAGLFKKQNKNPLLAACDIYRPAAIKQLQVVGGQLGIPVFEMGQTNPVDFYDQLSQLKNMGSLDEIAAMMPGMNAGALKGAQVDEKAMARTAAIIQSMTPYERENPSVLNSSRKRRIALGSGVKVEDINKLLKQFDMMNQMMKQFSGPGASRKMKRMGKLGGMGGLGGFPGL